jgi:small subunit ribosomal protein S5
MVDRMHARLAGDDEEKFDERIVDIARTAKVMKGGRRFAFRVVVVVGDNRGSVGAAAGKANQVPDAIRKGIERAKANMIRIPLVDGTIPHDIVAQDGATQVMLRPAAPGTGVIAGRGVRAVVEAAGISDILTKSQGSNNLLSVVRTTLSALAALADPQDVANWRHKALDEVSPYWSRYG